MISDSDSNTNFLQAYYGGEARCEEQAGGGDVYDPKELVCGGCSDVSRAQVGYLYVLMSLVLRLVTWEVKTRACSSFHPDFGKHFCDISTLLR